eukprot:2087388-Rhodomonas_salina.1
MSGCVRASRSFDLPVLSSVSVLSSPAPCTMKTVPGLVQVAPFHTQSQYQYANRERDKEACAAKSKRIPQAQYTLYQESSFVHLISRCR